MLIQAAFSIISAPNREEAMAWGFLGVGNVISEGQLLLASAELVGSVGTDLITLELVLFIQVAMAMDFWSGLNVARI